MSLYEFHGWFTLWQSDNADDDENIAFRRKTELIALMSGMDWLAGASDVVRLNSESYLRLHGTVDFSADRLADIDRILASISTRLPGSHGLLYERFDDENAPTGTDAFRVRVMTRGVVQLQQDPFFSHV
jgi:hypothetical protein